MEDHTIVSDMEIELLDVSDVAGILGLKPKTVHELVRLGKLACVQVTARNRKFRRSHIADFIALQTKNLPKPVDNIRPKELGLNDRGMKSLGRPSRAELKGEMARW
jgi:hypothetical protein